MEISITRAPSGSRKKLGRQAALVVACAVCATALAPASAGAVAMPRADPFYGVPANVGSYAPGTVLRSRRVSLGWPALLSTTAYQLLYRTKDSKDQPTATVATLLLPSASASRSRKLVAYETAEDSLTTNCSPSYTLRTGVATGTIGAEATNIDVELQQGWDVVVADYEGPLSEYGAGPLAGRATLDSIRAAESFAPARLEGASTPVGMTGYSGGAIATSSANALQPSYAPKLNMVADTAGGLSPDLNQDTPSFDGSAFFGVIIDVNTGLNRAYPELGFQQILNAKGRALSAQDGEDAGGCSGGLGNTPFGHMSEYTNYPNAEAFLRLPQVKSVYAHLDLITGPVPTAPTYYFQNIDDQLSIKPVDQLVSMYCSQGATIDYVRGPVGEHLSGAAVYFAGALQYIKDRFAGEPPVNSCPPGGHPPAPPATTRCPRATGRLAGKSLGRVTLGMTRLQVRRGYVHSSTRGKRYEDFFCLTPYGIRVGYASPKLVDTLPRAERKRLKARAVWASTSNPFYALRKARPGTTLAAARKHLRLTDPFHIGQNFWYLAPNGPSTAVLKVRDGIVEEIGIADKQLTDNRRGDRRLLGSFY